MTARDGPGPGADCAAVEVRGECSLRCNYARTRTAPVADLAGVRDQGALLEARGGRGHHRDSAREHEASFVKRREDRRA
jgi:hypothetical protein